MQVATPKKGYKFVKTSFGKYEEIPEEWEVSPIEKFLDIVMGLSPPSETYNSDSNGLPFFQGNADFCLSCAGL